MPAPAASSTGVLRPALKWPGGKRWQLPELRPLWAPHASRRLVEPFCGGLAVALGLRPARALLNDANPHLINFYAWVKKGLRLQIPLENDPVVYYANRERFNALLADGGQRTEEAAALFYYLNRTGYNGLCRFNGRGEFNVPFGQYTSINYATGFPAYQGALADWELRDGDFASLRLRATDFVYADPPYDGVFSAYARGGFSWADQERAARWLAEHRGPVVLVNLATPRIEELYRGLGYAVRYLSAPRRISCTGSRAPAREVIATRHL
jgi:DNA adenine methylase